MKLAKRSKLAKPATQPGTGRRRWRCLALPLLLAGCCSSTGAFAAEPAATVRAAVAANFRYAFEELAAAFQQRSAIQVRASFGASGMLYAQLQQGAPFDLFLSADSERPQRLFEAGFADQPPETYAIGRLVFWRPAGDARLEQTTRAPFAMANPRHAPYGQAARQCLQHQGLWSAAQANAVVGTSVGQTFHFVHSGAVAAGFIAASQLVAAGPATGSASAVLELPPDCHDPIRQQALVLRGDHADQAAALLAFLRSESAQQRLAELGYLPTLPARVLP